MTLNQNTLPSGVTIFGESSTTVTITANGGQWTLSMYVCIYTSIFITGVTIQMTEIQKQVMEGGIVRVCASLTGQLGRTVVVRLATSSVGTGEK